MSPRRVRASALPGPFLKWVGGKGQLLPELLARLPREFSAYHEPFLGGGALFFALHRQGLLRGKRVVLSDSNQELICTFRAVQADVAAVIDNLGQFRYDREQFYEVRAWDWRELEPAMVAARMIYLNRTGFNGLYRVNSKGLFNVPFGRYKNPRILDAANLRAAATALRRVELLDGPFEGVLGATARGDLVYFDPPYVPLSSTARFVAYTSQGFALADQEKLEAVFHRLSRGHVQAMLSNSCVRWVEARFKRYWLHRVAASRRVNSRADRRGPVQEVIVTNYPVRRESREAGRARTG